jgi:RNA polymerase sigma factor (sigma-70 family)
MANMTLDRLIHRLRADALRLDQATSLADGDLLECYVALRDETAFEALVRRHGPMVFGVCRRILRNDADAEDAFQATFLVLVRKASSIRPKGMVSNWLYGVAHNTALKARVMIQKRRTKESEAGMMPRGKSAEEAWTQMQSVVDTELSRLPDKYRVPIILCDLEGKTIKEVVHHLGWPQGTVASRLARGRAMLARRLTKHGLVMSAGVVAGALTQGAASASLPAALTATTVHAAGLLAIGKTAAASGVSATALALADGMLKAMLLVKLKAAGAAALLVAVLTGLGGVAYHWIGSADMMHSQSESWTFSMRYPREVKRGGSVDKIAELARKQTPPQPVQGMIKTLDQGDRSLVKTIKVQRVLIDHDFDLQDLHSHLRNIVAQRSHHGSDESSSTHVFVVVRKPEMCTPPPTTSHDEVNTKVVVRVSSHDLSRLKSSPEGKELAFMVWPDAEGEGPARVVTVVRSKVPVRTAPVHSEISAGTYGAIISNGSPNIVWVVFAKGQIQVVAPHASQTSKPASEPTGLFIGPGALAP